MSGNDLYLISPELSLVGLAALILLLDLFVPRKTVLVALAVAGLLVPLSLAISIWIGLGTGEGIENNGILAESISVDRFTVFFKVLFVSIAALVILISNEYVRRFEKFQIEFYVLMLFSVSGMMLLTSATELITLYVALELTALPIAALATFNRDSKSSEAGMKFLILSGISSAVLLYGMVLVYGFTGSTLLAEISVRIGQSLDQNVPFGSYALLLGVTLIIAGFGFKITAVPFHMWAPDVYEGSPTPVTALLSVASKAAGLAVVLRLFYTAFPGEMVAIEWSSVFAILAAISMTIGNLVAIAQSNIKRMLAYSTIAHGGYLMIGIAAVSVNGYQNEGTLGPSGVLFYLAGYALMNILAFSVVIGISNNIRSDNISDYAGMSKRAPYLAAALAFAMVSLTGIPPTVGFMVKIYMFGAAVKNDLIWLAVVGGVNSVVSAYYYLRIVKLMYLSPAPSEEHLRSGFPLRFTVLVTAAGVLFFGVYPTPLLDLARTAASTLVNGS